MTNTDLTAVLTSAHAMSKDTTGGRERPTQDEIARLAYHFFETRGRQAGHDLEDWLTAEQQLHHHYR